MDTWDAKLSQVVFGGDRVFLANLDRLAAQPTGCNPNFHFSARKMEHLG